MTEFSHNGVYFDSTDINLNAIKNLLLFKKEEDENCEWIKCHNHPDIFITTTGKLKVSEHLQNEGGVLLFTKGSNIYLSYRGTSYRKKYHMIRLKDLFFGEFSKINNIKCNYKENKFKDINNIFTITNLIYSGELMEYDMDDDEDFDEEEEIEINNKKVNYLKPGERTKHPFIAIWKHFPSRTKAKGFYQHPQGPAYGLGKNKEYP